MDERIKLLSYSALGTLHKCPRKFQLNRLNSEKDSPAEDDTSSVTFSFGHCVGEGIQLVLQGESEDQIFYKMFLMWSCDLLDRNDNQHKSFYLAMAAVQRFISLRTNGFLNDYEIVYYKGKPACELSFRITFPDGFKMRGSVDAVLRHRKTGEIVVLECKTSSAVNINGATFKNSSQAVGYSVVLDVIFPEISSYKVIYLVYKTKDMTYEPLMFNKSYLQRALWIQELLLDIETIKLYENSGVYPMRGESCYDFYRECEYFNRCTMSNKALVKTIDAAVVVAAMKKENEKVYDVELVLEDLIAAQMEKIS